MNPRQRVLTAMRREQPDRVPRTLGFTPAQQETFQQKTGAESPAEYWDFEARSVGFASPDPPTDYSRYHPSELPTGTLITEWGVARVPGSMYHFTRRLHPLAKATTVQEIVDYPLPDYTRAQTWQHLSADVAAFHGRELAVSGQLGQTLFEKAWLIRSMENLFGDMIERPALAEALLDRLLALRVYQARTYAQAGVDIVGLGDDVGSQKGMLMSPAMWRRWLKPRLARVIEAAREAKPDVLIWYHSDGDCRAVIPELIEIGVDILNPIQPECMDPATIKAEYGDRLAFWGTIGTQSTMPWGTPAEVRAVVKERIETVGRGGGLLLAPTHVLEPEVPWENVLAFLDAVEEHGKY